ncbi:calcium-binding protein [Saccharothrix sp. ALI-22-I]|uniref:EF-hand domain-containing protein n=1 Tax=Saccharothrix sp. ALI-22-I TaxID=1933778 RepID=UPI00097C6871|nr:EF-hand domain-containing protein [Saccharothrix sp. ALI-22-I]ONI92321.1 calcium-binding protein [Saccharothrix sp. ALI-22-I]
MDSTTQDLVSTKIAMAFDALNLNGNGQLEWADYEALISRYLQAYNVSEDDRRARALRAYYQMYWLELLRHSGVSGDSLTKEQFTTATRLATIDTSRLNAVEGGAHAIFDFIDADGDDEITKGEFSRYLRDVLRIQAPDAMDAFSALDTDSDGIISRSEFIRSAREYLA